MFRMKIAVAVLALSASIGGASSQDFVKGRLLVKFKASASDAQKAESIGKVHGKVAKKFESLGLQLIELPAGANERAQAALLKGRNGVDFAEPDFLFKGAYVSNDPQAGSEWHLAKIEANAAWDLTKGNAGVIIAILDSGVNPTSDLAQQLVPGWNFYSNNGDTTDVNGHGSMVAGVASAATDNSNDVAGIGFNCKIMPLRISDSTGTASASSMAAALQYAADHGARVANLSFPASGSATVRSAAQYFMNKGGVVTMSSGNSGAFDATAENPYVLTVSASTSSDTIAGFSTTGNMVDCAAPGDSILTTSAGGGSTWGSGTSFSAPAAAGVLALMYSANPNLGGQEASDLLKGSCDDLGPAGWDPGYGWGRINARRAVEAAQSGSGLDITNPSVAFSTPTNNAMVSGSVSVFITASDNTAVDHVSFFVDGSLVGTKVSAPYSWAWDSKSVPDSYHTLSATAWDLAGNNSTASIGVNVRNSADTTPPSVRITSPGDGTKIGSKLLVYTYANDDVKVTKVELYVDGKLSMSSTTSPYTFNVGVRKLAAGAHTLQEKAYDAAGNVGVSSIVNITK
jgi:thermitase